MPSTTADELDEAATASSLSARQPMRTRDAMLHAASTRPPDLVRDATCLQVSPSSLSPSHAHVAMQQPHQHSGRSGPEQQLNSAS